MIVIDLISERNYFPSKLIVFFPNFLKDATVKVSRDDIILLHNGGWMSDTIISYHFSQIKIQNVALLPPATTEVIKVSDQQGMEAICNEWDLKTKKMVIFAMINSGENFIGNHWFTLVWYAEKREFIYYDSKYKPENIRDYRITEFCEKYAECIGVERFGYAFPPYAHQKNDDDCGIYVTTTATMLCRMFEQNGTIDPNIDITPEVIRKNRHKLSIALAAKYNVIELLESSDEEDFQESPDMFDDLEPQPTQQKDSDVDTPMPSRRSLSANGTVIDKPFNRHDKSRQNIRKRKRRPPLSVPAEHDEMVTKMAELYPHLSKLKHHRKRPEEANVVKGRNNCTGPEQKKERRNKNRKAVIGIRMKQYEGPLVERPTTNLQQRVLKEPKLERKKFRKETLQRYKKPLQHDEEVFTIVRGLSSFIKPEVRQQFLNEFHTHVEIISAMTIELSLMVHLYCTDLLQTNPNAIIDTRIFRRFIASLKQKNRGETAADTRALNRKYFQLRAEYGLPPSYDGTNKTNTLAVAADTYQVNLANNVRDHMYRRIHSFFKITHPNMDPKIIYKTMDVLFNSNSKYKSETNRQLIRSLERELNFVGTFHTLNDRWYKFIPMLYRLQQWRRQRNLKNFIIFPIMTHKRHHVHFDGQSLQQFLRKWKYSPNDYNQFDENMAWRKYFYIQKVQTSNHRFRNQISTDGVSVHIHMQRKKVISKPSNVSKKLGKTIVKVKGFDPGLRESFAGVSLDMRTGVETNVKYSSASFRYDCQEHRLTQKYHRWTNDVLNRIRNERNGEPDKASPMANQDVFIRFQLKNFNELQSLLGQKKFAKLTLQRYICKQKAIVAVARKLTGYTYQAMPKQRDTVVFIGFKVDDSPSIKGYVRTPKRAIIRTMALYAHIIYVNEFRSTMLCSQCFQPCRTSSSPHRWQYCILCKKTFNRDINGGRNILYIGLKTLLGLPMDRGFSNSFHFEK